MQIKDDDSGLMLLFQKGDNKAFETLLLKYEKPVLNYVNRFIRDKIKAEDITQEAFFRVYKSKDIYKPIAKFSTWLYSIATNLCIDYKRKLSSDALAYPDNLSDNNEKIHMYENSIEKKIENDQTDAIIKDAILSLPERERAALILQIYENKPYKEIAQILNTSAQAVESLLFRARQKLKKSLKKLI